jgi:hypothetical protein
MDGELFAPAGAHRLVAGQERAQRIHGRGAELGGDREEVMDARRFVMFAALDVAADEGGDREVPAR